MASSTIEISAPPEKRQVTVSISTVLFWLAAALMLFWSLGVRELWTAEDRWAEITRNMLQSGDYFHPRINGMLYFDKPLAGYWLIALVAKLTGTLDEYAIRLPSAMAGFATLWLTIYLARKLWTAEAGRIAGWLLLICYGFIFWSRTGQSDMENVAFSLAAIAWYWSRRDRLGFTTFGIFYAICFIGAHMKGLGAIAVPCVAIAPDLLRKGRWKQLFRPPHLAAALLGLLIYSVPFLAEGPSGLLLVFRENILRFVQPFDHKEPFYVYFYYLPIFLAPWTPIFFIALAAGVARRRELLHADYPTRWAMEAAALIFLFFTASGSRRSNYILPEVPFCALLCARFLISSGAVEYRTFAARLQSNIHVVLAVGGLLACAIWPLVQNHFALRLPMGFLLGLSICSTVSILLSLLGRWRPSMFGRLVGIRPDCAIPVVTAAVLMCGYFCFQFVQLDSLRTTKKFVIAARAFSKDAKDLAFYDPSEDVSPTGFATVAYYLNNPDPHTIFRTPEEASRFLSRRPGANRLMLRRDKYEKLLPQMSTASQCQQLAEQPASAVENRGDKSRHWVIIQVPLVSSAEK